MEDEDGFNERCGGLFSDDADLEKLGTENASTIVCLVGRQDRMGGGLEFCYMIVRKRQDGREGTP